MKIIISILVSLVTLNTLVTKSLRSLDFLGTDCPIEILENKNEEINEEETEELNRRILLILGSEDSFKNYSKENKKLFTSILIPIHLTPPEYRF